MKKVKTFFSLQNIVIILSALFIAFKVYATLPTVEENKTKIEKLEKDKAVIETKLDIALTTLNEVRYDIKQILKENKF